MRTVFIDESKRGRYTMVAVSVDNRDLAAVRRQLRQLIPAGQRRIHFKSDSPTTRQRALHTIIELPVVVLLTIGPQHTRQALARTWCLTQITAHTPTGDRLILEIDQGIVDQDRSDLDHLTSEHGLTYSHMTPHSDPGLWLPDAIGWCWTRGNHWRDTITPLIARTITAQ